VEETAAGGWTRNPDATGETPRPPPAPPPLAYPNCSVIRASLRNPKRDSLGPPTCSTQVPNQFGPAGPAVARRITCHTPVTSRLLVAEPSVGSSG
jgi:hypothetical protein